MKKVILAVVLLGLFATGYAVGQRKPPRNVGIEVVGTNLILTIDLTQEATLSKSGKSYTLASTGFGYPIPEAGVTISLTVSR